MSKNHVLLLTLLFVAVIAFIGTARSQVSNPDLIALSNNQLTFEGDGTQNQLTRQVTVVGLAQNVQVSFFSAQIYDNSSQNKLTMKDITPFTLSTNQQKQVDITIDTTGAKPAVYSGTIVVTAANSENSTTKNISISITITQPQIILPQIGIIAVVFVLLLIALLLSIFDKLVWAIIVSFSALIVWFSLMVVAVLKLDIVTAISTAVIIPFTAFIIDSVKKKSDEKAARVKASTDILATSINDDIKLLVDVVGETSTHFSRFQPEFERSGTIPKTPDILYPESGILSTAVWDKNCRQGVVSDLPTLPLEKYYNYVGLYNEYYKAAMMLSKQRTLSADNKEFMERFENLRKKYADLETVLFVDMSYYIGLFGKTRLSPLRIEYPRVTRVLLYKLIDYGILGSKTYLTQKELDEALKNAHTKKEFAEYSFNKTKEEEIAKKEDELGKYSDAYKSWEEEQKAIWEKGSAAEINKTVDEDKFELWLLRKKIENWDLTAKDLNRVLKDIYEKNDLPKFYNKVGEDFSCTYRRFLQAIRDLKPLPEEFLKKQKMSDAKQHEVLKALLEELEKLNKLKKEDAILEKEFEDVKKKVLEWFNA